MMLANAEEEETETDEQDVLYTILDGSLAYGSFLLLRSWRNPEENH